MGGAAGSAGAAGTAGTAGRAIELENGTVHLRSGTYLTGGDSETTAINAAAGTLLTFSGTNTLGGPTSEGGLTSVGAVNLGGMADVDHASVAASTQGHTMIGSSEVVNTTIHGDVSITDGVLITGIGRDQSRSGRILQGDAEARTNTFDGTNIRPYVTDIGISHGNRVVLVQSGNAGTSHSGIDVTVGQTTSARFAPDSSYNTVVRSWSAGTGGMAGFGGTDKFGETINDTDLVLRADIRTAAQITGDRTSGQQSAFDVAANFGGTSPTSWS